MKLTIFYENLREELEVDTNEMWSCLKLTSDKELTEEEREKMIQDKVDKEWNKPDLNNWLKFNRHRGRDVRKEELTENDETKDEMDLFPDMKKNSYEKEFEYVEICKKIKKILKNYKDWADIVIAVALDGYSVAAYAEKVGSSRKAISKKYNKAIKVLKEFYK